MKIIKPGIARLALMAPILISALAIGTSMQLVKKPVIKLEPPVNKNKLHDNNKEKKSDVKPNEPRIEEKPKAQRPIHFNPRNLA